MIAEQYK